MAMTQQQQKQIAMVALSVGIFGYLYISQLLKPKQAEILAKETELVTVNARIDALRVTANQRDQLLKRVEELKVQVAAVEKRLPRDRNLQDIIRVVSDLAAKSGIRYSSFAPSMEQTSQLFVEIPIGMSISGSVFSIGKFLAAIGQQERILSARNLSLTFSADPKKNQTVTGSFTLVAFVYNG
ncbi:MAG: type 4a pilus biogenesis protein PilO [Elusimicrobia bacterium]|nr:type 4a pilus biogenesis protein PilO [Elusimicrobiota bacterium]